jgi:hypothetical protein
VTSTTSTTYVPWFLRHQGLATAGVVVMFAMIATLRVALGSEASVGITLLYVVPISLAALTWGRLAGVVASAAALLALVLWVWLDDVALTAVGWAARVVPLVVAGLLLGDTSDRLRRAEAAHVAQLERELLHRQAVEINDSLLQGVSAAKWALEVGNHELALKSLSETMSNGQRLVSDLIRESEMGPLSQKPAEPDPD